MNLIKAEFIKNYSIKRTMIICLVLLIFSMFLINVIDPDVGKSRGNYLERSIRSLDYTLDQILLKKEKSFEDEYHIFEKTRTIEYIKKLQKQGVETQSDWRFSVIYDNVLPLVIQNYLIEKLRENPNHPNIVEACNSESQDSLNKNSTGFENLCDNIDSKNLEKLYQTNSSMIEDYEKIIEKNYYYLYLEYQVSHNFLENDPWISQLIDQKVESNMDFLGLNYMQYQAINNNRNYEIDAKYHKEIPKLKTSRQAILLYSTMHGIKHDLSYNYFDMMWDDLRYMNTKLKVNQVFHLSVIVMIIVSITSGGIVSREHSQGTIKNIITAPVQRWKILLSKFIYLVLDTYIIWFLGLLILSLCAGIQYGFHDLFTPKLIFINGQVIEVNYYLYIIKNMLIASIPLICFLSILFFLTTVTRNTSLTVGITTSLGIISPFLWLLKMAGNFKYIVYTPLWYFDCGFIFNRSDVYIESLDKIDFNLSMGIIISLVVAVLLYIISNVIYIKEDIKN